MKPKTMILMGVAIVCGLGAAVMTSSLLAGRNEKVVVLMPKQKYSQWTAIKDPQGMFQETEVLKSDAPKTAVLKLEDLKDRTLLRSVSEGQAIVQEDLQPKDISSMDQVLPAGKRAVAINTNAAANVGGFVLPGCHVDVLHSSPHHGNSGPESKVILQNILVRAVDLTSVRPDDKQGVVPATVTLEVTLEEALVLAEYKDSGAISLALRPAGDNEKVALDEPAVVPPPPPPPAPKVEVAAKPETPADRKTMMIYNGSKVTQATYVTKDGVTTTEIVSSQGDTGSSAAPAPAPPELGKGLTPTPANGGPAEPAQPPAGKEPPANPAPGAAAQPPVTGSETAKH